MKKSIVIVLTSGTSWGNKDDGDDHEASATAALVCVHCTSLVESDCGGTSSYPPFYGGFAPSLYSPPLTLSM